MKNLNSLLAINNLYIEKDIISDITYPSIDINSLYSDISDGSGRIVYKLLCPVDSITIDNKTYKGKMYEFITFNRPDFYHLDNKIDFQHQIGIINRKRLLSKEIKYNSLNVVFFDDGSPDFAKLKLAL